MILITGGAGYIGSHCVKEFLNINYDCVILDDLSEGHSEAVLTDNFCKVNLLNKSDVEAVFDKYKIDAVIHFASNCYVGESVTNPSKYYRNNIISTLNLLDTMIERTVKNIVFSSSCATYGLPQYVPIDENHPQAPVNPYGMTKFFIEKILKDYDTAYGLKYIALRYFNAAGASSDCSIGESHSPETHLIPLILQVAKGERESIKVFGSDYDTPDGTCIRDYIHVEDLANAHRLAVEKLLNGGNSDFINLGTGNGHSVKEIIEIVEKVTGKPVKKEYVERREGDPSHLVAANDKAKNELNWVPKYDIETIVKTAWDWELSRKY